MNTVPDRDTTAMNPADPTLVSRAKTSAVWSLLGQIVPRLVTPFALVILTTLLNENAYGIFAVSTLILTFGDIVISSGWSAAIIQNKSANDELSSVAFTLSVMSAALCFVVVWLAAPYIANSYGSETLITSIRVCIIYFFLSALSAIPIALLQREMRFRQLFWIMSGLPIVSNLVAIGWAFAGGGFWALIAGQIAGAGIKVVLVWRIMKWRPSLRFRWSVAQPLFTFSFWIITASVQNWLYFYGDNAIAGAFLGTAGLGVYALAYTLSVLIPGTIVSALGAVAYSAFSAMQDDPAEVGRSLVKLTQRVASLNFPICFGLSLIAVPLVSLVYGSRWAGLGETLRVLAILPGGVAVWWLNGEALRAVRKPSAWTLVALINLVMLLPLLYIAAPYGLQAFSLARFVGALPVIPLSIVATRRILKVRIVDQLRALWGPIAACLVMYAVGSLVLGAMGPFSGWVGVAQLGIVISVSVAVYALSLSLFDPGLFSILRLSVLSYALKLRSRVISKPQITQ